MKTIKTLLKKQVWMKGMLGVAVCLTAFLLCGFVSEAAEGKIKADTAKIRAEANTGSEVVGSTVKGKVIDILDAVKDSSGMVWYKVSVTGGGYGYIRSDLVETSEKIEVSEGGGQSSSTTASTDENKEKPAATVPTAITEQKATVSQSSVRIRSGASTAHDTVASLPQGTSITLIGEAKDSAGNKWYQMTCSYDNKNIEGYIRSDLITIGGAPDTAEGSELKGETSGEGEGTEVPEGEGTEGEGAEAEGEGEGSEGGEEEPQEPVEPVNNDYSVVYTEDLYWLYDNINGTRYRVDDLMNMVSTVNATTEKLEAEVQKEKIIIIILAVIVVIMVIVVTILLLKIRSLYYEDYDEEDEEEEEPEPEPVRKKVKRTAIEEEPAPVRKKRPVSEEAVGKERAAKRRPEQAELKAAQDRPPVKKAPRKSQNFLLDDDEFEFEFLNMDDKDL